MEKEKLDTKELYGVFSNDGTFKVYYYTIIEGAIHCLFKDKIALNTIMREEIKMFSPLVVYNPDNSYQKIQSQNWMKGEVFLNGDKYYRAIRLDILLERILYNNFEVDDEKSIIELETTINSGLNKNKEWYNEIWENVLEENQKTKKREIL